MLHEIAMMTHKFSATQAVNARSESFNFSTSFIRVHLDGFFGILDRDPAFFTYPFVYKMNYCLTLCNFLTLLIYHLQYKLRLLDHELNTQQNRSFKSP